jgi:hypothetical protein
MQPLPLEAVGVVESLSQLLGYVWASAPHFDESHNKELCDGKDTTHNGAEDEVPRGTPHVRGKTEVQSEDQATELARGEGAEHSYKEHQQHERVISLDEFHVKTFLLWVMLSYCSGGITNCTHSSLTGLV